MNDEHNCSINLNDIPDRVSLSELHEYIPSEIELFSVCESYSRKKKINDKYAEVLFTSQSYHKCVLFARKLRIHGNHNKLTIHNLRKRASGAYNHYYVNEWDPKGATFENSIKLSSSQRKYLKNNHLGVYSKDDGLTTDMYDKYMSLLNKKDNK